MSNPSANGPAKRARRWAIKYDRSPPPQSAVRVHAQSVFIYERSVLRVSDAPRGTSGRPSNVLIITPFIGSFSS